MAKQNESASGSEKAQSRAERESAQEEQVIPAPTPDAAQYVVQPTSYVLPVQAQAKGGVPEMRFSEEVLKGSDEDFGGGQPSHPEENQPVPGIAEGDEVPDTTGRAANQALKKSR